MARTRARTGAPSVTPVSVAEAKTHLRVTSSAEDTYIGTLVDAATGYVDADGVLGRAMVTQTWTEWFPQSPGWAYLTIGPVQAITNIDYYDVDGVIQADTLANYELWQVGEDTVCKPKDTFVWPAAQSRPDAIRVTYTAGFGDAASDVPDTIRHAILMLVGHWYQSRGTVSDVTMKDVPMAFDALIGVERAGWYG